MSVAVIQTQWQPAGLTPRFGFLLILAMALHLVLIIWWNIKPQPDFGIAEPMRVRLLPAPLNKMPVAIPIQQPPARIFDSMTPARKTLLPVIRKALPSEPPVPIQVAPLPESSPRPSAAELLGSLRKYNLSNDPAETFVVSGSQIRVLGDPPPGDVMLALQDRMPDLPFGSSGLQLAFYSSGFRGDLERFGDAVTQEFGFRTRYGTQVKCVLMVVLLVCGWD